MLAADKAGDVHRFSVTPESELCQSQIVEDSPLLGHVSMILDMVGNVIYWPTVFEFTILIFKMTLIFFWDLSSMAVFTDLHDVQIVAGSRKCNSRLGKVGLLTSLLVQDFRTERALV